MGRAILALAIISGLILAVAGKSACEDVARAKEGELIVLFIKAVEESVDKQESQVLTDTMLPTYLGDTQSFLVGGGVPVGDGNYLDVGQRFDFRPTKISGQTIWVVVESSFTDHVKNGQGEWKPLEKRTVTKRKLELGKVVVGDPWKWNLNPKSQLHIEYRIERMTEKEYALADAKAREAAKKRCTTGLSGSGKK